MRNRVATRTFSPEQEPAVIDYYLNTPNSSIMDGSKKFNVGWKSILNVLKRNNIPIKSRAESIRQYELDQSFFSVIDTEAKAYFLGLLMADGCISGNVMVINLEESDVEILEKFKIELSYSGPIRFTPKKGENVKNQRTLAISSTKLTNDLIKHGIIPRKTHFADLPTTIPNELIHHFIRGVFDGDGCPFINYNKKNNFKHLLFSLVGNNLLIEKIQNILIEKCNLNRTKIRRASNSKDNIVTFSYGGTPQVHRISDYLYKDATIFLKRKREIMFTTFPKAEKKIRRCKLCETKHFGKGYCSKHYQQKFILNKNI